MRGRPESDARSPRRIPPRPSETKSSGSKVAYDACFVPSIPIAVTAPVEDGGAVEEQLEVLGHEEASRGLLAPDPEVVPVYEPEALVW